jgi:hypothetical protein
MSNVTRHTYTPGEMSVNRYGEWVEYSDYESLLDVCASLENRSMSIVIQSKP